METCQHCNEEVKFGLPPCEDGPRAFFHIATGIVACGEPVGMTNDQIAEMIFNMTDDEEPKAVLSRVLCWDTEEWSQCDPNPGARQLTPKDELEVIQFLAGLLRINVKGG